MHIFVLLYCTGKCGKWHNFQAKSNIYRILQIWILCGSFTSSPILTIFIKCTFVDIITSPDTWSKRFVSNLKQIFFEMQICLFFGLMVVTFLQICKGNTIKIRDLQQILRKYFHLYANLLGKSGKFAQIWWNLLYLPSKFAYKFIFFTSTRIVITLFHSSTTQIC